MVFDRGGGSTTKMEGQSERLGLGSRSHNHRNHDIPQAKGALNIGEKDDLISCLIAN